MPPGLPQSPRAEGEGGGRRSPLAGPSRAPQEGEKLPPRPTKAAPPKQRRRRAKALRGRSRSGASGPREPHPGRRTLGALARRSAPARRSRRARAGRRTAPAAPPRGKRASQKDHAAASSAKGSGIAAALPRARPSPLRRVLATLSLPKVEVSEATRRVNLVRDLVFRAVKKTLKRPVGILGTGSYYEHLKIAKPDEFDIMLIVTDVRVDLEPCDAGDCKGVYHFVKPKRNQNLDDFVDGQHLSASKILSAMRTIIIKEVKTINEMTVTVEKKKPGSPAVTLRIGEPPSDISVDIILALEMCSKTLGNIRKGGADIKTWLGLNQEKQLSDMKLCLVPKNAKVGAHFKDTWRLSFSLAEKTIIQYHGNAKTCCEMRGSKCCRKDCLKLLKYLLEQLKTKHQNRNQFNKFCSYYAKTAFFHACTKWTSDDEWLPTNLEECFERLLDYFLDCLRRAELKHFFIPDCNLFCRDLKCSVLAKVIESERTNGFPIFEQTEAI